jgi:hypothetical protein
MARAHRIGQTQNVVVYRLVTKGTYEQRMLEIAGKKMALDTAVLGGAKSSGSKNKMGGLNASQIDELLRYGAYHVFNTNDDEEQADRIMQEENIDEILKRCSTIIHNEEGEAESSISKVSFSVSEKDRGVDFNDENFWEKVLPEFKTLDSLKQDLTEVKILLANKIL